MTSDIKSPVCEKFKRNNSKEPLVQENTPEYPWQRVSVDLFEYAGYDYISIIDAYSGYLYANKIENKSSKHICEVLRNVFNHYGYPTEIRCDNVPFNSREFELFSNESNIIFKYSSPRYPQSNGLAEKGVAIAKNILKKCFEENAQKEFAYRILGYNVTPVACN